MKKVNNQYIDKLVRKFISENISNKADDIMSQINELGGMEDNHPRFGSINLAKMTDKEIEDLLKQPMDDIDVEYDNDEEDNDFNEEPLYEIEMGDSEVCECGSNTMVSEGMCMECGLPKMDEGIDDYAEPFGDDDQSFDYIEEEDDVLDFDFEEERDEKKDNEKEDENSEFCRYQKRIFGRKDERYREKCTGKSAVKDLASMEMNLNEKLHGRQKNIDKNRNGRIDAEDFKMLRGKKNNGEMGESRYVTSKGGRFDREEMPMSRQDMEMGMNNMTGFDLDLEEFCSHHHNMDTPECQSYYNHNSEVDEGNAFTGALANAKKHHRDEFSVDGKKFHVKESVKLTEDELVNLIENLVNEKETKGLKTLAKPKGMSEYERAFKGSGRENKEAISATNKKMKEYVKYGSKGEYNESPKFFPKGNGELSKMDKKAFSLTDENEDMNYEIAGLNIPVPDAIEFNEDMMDKYYEGSSETGNKPGGNALESEANSRFNKLRKKRTLDKIKKQSYNKSPQPVYNEKSGQEKGEGIKIKLESTEKQTTKLNEEFDKMKSLIFYDRKTQ